MKQPLIYIILVNWNGLKHSIDCINSLNKIAYKNYKILVVDNGSKDNEAERIEKLFSKITVIKNKSNLGFSCANNQGIKLALKNEADFVLLLNNDTVVKNDFLNILVDYAIANNFQGILSPKILYYRSKTIWAMGGKLSILTSIPQMIGQGKQSKKYNNTLEPHYAPGCAMLISKEIIKKVGLLDKKYFAYYEDMDYSFRVKKAGFKIKVIPKSTMWHKVSKSTKQRPGKVGKTMGYLMARNGLMFGYKNYEGLHKIYYIFAQLFIKLPLYLVFKVNDFESAIAYIQGVIQGLKLIVRNKAVDSKLKNYV